MDTKTKKQRRINMQHIHSSDTKPEIVLRKALWSKGIRYRKNFKNLPGKPDIAITKYRIAIFVDGEFWHGKDYDGYGEGSRRKYSSLHEALEHSDNSSYWLKKIQRNMERDRQVTATLEGMDWAVIRFWSRDVLKHTDECVNTILETVLERKLEK